MGKRFVYILMMLVLILAGCKAEPDLPATVPTETNIPTETTLPAETLPAPTTESTTEATQESTTIETTQAPTIPEESVPSTIPEETQSRLPYLQKIERCDQSIYDGPGYDYSFVCTVREAGTYTIVEEFDDGEGNLWGKLKSGIGWVDLTQIQSKNYVSALISANFADENLIRNGSYHHYSTNQEYSIPITFYAYGTIQDVTLFDMEFRDEGFVPRTDLFTVAEITRDKPLVAELDFPGDMSTYGIRFLDKTGATHTYYIYMSGRNGDILLTKNVF